MTTKLEIINSAAIATGHLPVAVEFDGSDEWTIGDAAFERALPTTLARHNWPFAKKTAALARTGDSTLYGFTDKFSRPTDILQALSVTDTTWGSTVPWVYKDGAIHAAQNAGLIEYIAAPAYEAWPPLFVETMRLFVEAAFYRAREAHQVAQAREQRAEMMLQEAASRGDQETGKRALFRSRIREARAVRRG
jgi:hypothetical protein